MDDERRGRSLEERYRRLLDSQAVLARVARDLGSALELGHALRTVLAAMRSLVEFRGGAICLVEGGHVRIGAADPPVSEEVAQLRLPVGSGLAGRAVALGTTVYSPDLDDDDRVDPAVRGLGSNAIMRSYLAVPLVCLGQVTGLLQVDAAEPDAFADEDRLLLEGLAIQVAGAIESARRYQEVMELERLKSDFVARVSHELRTPLTIMSGFVSTLIAHGDALAPDARNQMLHRIDMATTRLAGLIDELLLVSRLEAGIVVAQTERVPLAPILEDVRRESADPASVRVECPPDLELETDVGLLKRSLGMLVDNALKYGEAAAVTGRPGEIEIADDGPGIPSEIHDTLFELFTRGSSATIVPGMGVGLPVARTLLASLGADLRLEPGARSGTRALVLFRPTPADEAAPRAHAVRRVT